jgi:hypothetical protein
VEAESWQRRGKAGYMGEKVYKNPSPKIHSKSHQGVCQEGYKINFAVVDMVINPCVP